MMLLPWRSACLIESCCVEESVQGMPPLTCFTHMFLAVFITQSAAARWELARPCADGLLESLREGAKRLEGPWTPPKE